MSEKFTPAISRAIRLKIIRQNMDTVRDLMRQIEERLQNTEANLSRLQESYEKCIVAKSK